MERYNRRTNGYEAQGNIEITRNGCQQRTHRFAMVNCETADDCAQGRRVTFRTEPCDGSYYELTGRVREMQQNDCDTCNQQANYTQKGCDTCNQQANYTQKGCDTCNQQANYTQKGCDTCNQQANYTQRNDTYDQQNGTYTQQNNTYTKRCSNCGNDRMIIDHADCDDDDVSAIWTGCREKTCGCNRARQDNAFTYESIRREQKNGNRWDNWLRNGNNTL